MSNEKLADALEHTARHRAATEGIDPDQWRVVLFKWEALALQAHAAEAAQTRDTMTPRELAKRIGRGENWKMVDEPAQAQAQSGECQRNSPAGCDCIDTCVAISQPQAAEPVRQFRVAPKGSVWTDVKDPEIWASVTAHPESYETRVLYTHPQPAQDAKCPYVITSGEGTSHCRLAEQDTKDAARYRWLRGDGGPTSVRWPRWVVRNRTGHWNPVQWNEMDAAIDAAMAKESGR